MSYSSSEFGRLPLGVAILSVLIGILGALLLIAGIVVLAFATAGALAGFAVFGVGLVGGIVLLIAALILLTMAGGLWNQELWALVLSIVVIGVLWLSVVLQGGFLTLGGLVLGVLLVYLVAVHRHFI